MPTIGEVTTWPVSSAGEGAAAAAGAASAAAGAAAAAATGAVPGSAAGAAAEAGAAVAAAAVAGATAATGIAGVEVRVLEADDDIGGRVRTDVIDGFRALMPLYRYFDKLCASVAES